MPGMTGRQRMTWRQQWDSYADRPPGARWTSRASMLAGAVLLAALTLLACRAGVWLFVTVWEATSW